MSDFVSAKSPRPRPWPFFAVRATSATPAMVAPPPITSCGDRASPMNSTPIVHDTSGVSRK
jgi:hypothetical protein